MKDVRPAHPDTPSKAMTMTVSEQRPTLVPAVMFEIVQHASFLMLFLWLVVKSWSRQLSAPQLMTTCVCMSLPVTMLPTVRSAGTSTAAEWCLQSNNTATSRNTQT